jgi:hypothetical protein
VNALIDTGLKVPWEFRMAAEYVLTRQLNEEVLRQRGSGDPTDYSGALEVVEEARRRGYSLDQSECARIFGEMLLESMGDLTQSLTAASCARVLSRIVLAESLTIELELEDCQDLLFELVQRRHSERPWQDFERSFVELMEKIGLSSSLL